MLSKMPYDTILSEIKRIHLKKRHVKLSSVENKELMRLKRIKITRDYRTRKKMKKQAKSSI